MQSAKFIQMHAIYALMLCTLTGYSSALFAVPNCQLPKKIKSWDYYAQSSIRSGRDWKNSTTNTDYWQLVYSWSPQYCRQQPKKRAARLYQCQHQLGFIVHGLWAQSVNAKNYKQHPRNCVDAPALKAALLKQYFCLMPDVRLMQKQWEKHGSCDFKRPNDYFLTIERLNTQLKLPDKKMMDQLESAPPAKLRQWLVKHNRVIGLQSSHIKIKRRGKSIQELSICYDMRFKLRQCNAKYKSRNNRVSGLTALSSEQKKQGSHGNWFEHLVTWIKELLR